jgi:hypothetical protein
MIKNKLNPWLSQKNNIIKIKQVKKSQIMVKIIIQMMHIREDLREVDLEELINIQIIITEELEVVEELIEEAIEIIMMKIRILVILMNNHIILLGEEAHQTIEVVEDLIIKMDSLNLIKQSLKKTINKLMNYKMINNNLKELLEDIEEITKEEEIKAINNEELIEELEGSFKEAITEKENTLEETEVAEVIIEAAEEDIKMVIRHIIKNQNINNKLSNKYKMMMKI